MKTVKTEGSGETSPADTESRPQWKVFFRERERGPEGSWVRQEEPILTWASLNGY